MSACPRCGDPNQTSSPRCTRCGTELAPRPERLGAATMLGMPGPAAAAGPAMPAFSPKQTLLGIVPGPMPGSAAPPLATQAVAATAPAPPVMAAPFDAKRTLIGGLSGSVPPPQPGPSQGPGAAPGLGLGLGATTLGLAPAQERRIPTQAPATERSNVHDAPPSSSEPRVTLHPGGESAAVGSTLLGMHAPAAHAALELSHEPQTSRGGEPSVRPAFGGPRTLMGVATPGVAPLNPGVPKRISTPPPVAYSEPLTPAPVIKAGAQRSGGRLLLAAAALLLCGLGVFWVLWTPPAPLTARAQPNAHGPEHIELACADCPPGSRVKLGDASEQFVGGKAVLALGKALQIGNNTISVALERPGLGRNENFNLNVPLRFRVSADTTKLSDPEPRFGVRIEAAPTASVTLDQKPVALNGQETTVLLEPGGALQGADAEVRWLERKVEYSIVVPETPAEAGNFSFRVPITPLLIYSPGPSIVIESERFILSGHTQPGGKISVSGYPLSVTPEGGFSQLMDIDSEGETTIAVRADAPGQAPRFVQLKIRRVKSLAAAAEQFRAGAKTQYSDVLAAARGGVEQSAVLSGIVEEARTVDHSTTVLLDVEEGCSARPCLAKIVYQQNFAVEKGAQLEALGVTRETMRSPFDDKQIPVLQAAFLLSKEAPKDHSRAKLPKAEGPATAAKASRGFGY